MGGTNNMKASDLVHMINEYINKYGDCDIIIDAYRGKKTRIWMNIISCGFNRLTNMPCITIGAGNIDNSKKY